MDKRKLIAETARKSNYAKWEVNKIADFFLESITDALSRGEDIHLNGFGKFELKVRKERNAIHPRSKKPVLIKEKMSVTFTVSKSFKPDQDVVRNICSRNNT